MATSALFVERRRTLLLVVPLMQLVLVGFQNATAEQDVGLRKPASPPKACRMVKVIGPARKHRTCIDDGVSFAELKSLVGQRHGMVGEFQLFNAFNEPCDHLRCVLREGRPPSLDIRQSRRQSPDNADESADTQQSAGPQFCGEGAIYCSTPVYRCLNLVTLLIRTPEGTKKSTNIRKAVQNCLFQLAAQIPCGEWQRQMSLMTSAYAHHRPMGYAPTRLLFICI